MKCKCVNDMTQVRLGLPHLKTMLVNYCEKCGRLAMGDAHNGIRWFQSEKSMNNDLISRTDTLNIIEKQKPDKEDTSPVAGLKFRICENIKEEVLKQKIK